MQYWLYNISIFAYTILVFTISPFHKKGKKWIRGRRNWLVKLQDIRKTSENWIWFHCSSLGEYEDCCEVFFAIQKRHPNSKTLLTFFSPSGYEAIEKSAEFDAVMYLPVDSMSRVNSFLDHLRPKLIVFARSEIWLNYLRGIRERKIPLFLIALKMNEKSGFLKHPKLYRNGFESFTHIYCQDETTQYLLKERFGVGNSSVIGNTRFERICKESLAKKEFPELLLQGNAGYLFESMNPSALAEQILNFLENPRKYDPQLLEWATEAFDHEKVCISVENHLLG